jgi:glutathione S-transferase
MLTVHHLGVSQSERIVWLREELGIPYTLKVYARDPVTHHAPAECKALHPMGIAPVITDGELVLAESGAVIDYIIGTYGSGRLALGASDANFADYLFWFHFSNGTLMPVEMIATMYAMAPLPEGNPLAALLESRGHRSYGMMEKRLGEARYFAGDDFTAADI